MIAAILQQSNIFLFNDFEFSSSWPEWSVQWYFKSSSFSVFEFASYWCGWSLQWLQPWYFNTFLSYVLAFASFPYKVNFAVISIQSSSFMSIHSHIYAFFWHLLWLQTFCCFSTIQNLVLGNVLVGTSFLLFFLIFTLFLAQVVFWTIKQGLNEFKNLSSLWIIF